MSANRCSCTHPSQVSGQYGTTRGSRSFRVRAAAAQTQDGPVVRLAVSAATATLRLLQGRKDIPDVAAEGPAQPRPGTIAELMQCIEMDFERGYIITGIIGDEAYSPGCFFGDPTVSFSGLQKWKQNLQLLVPFLEEPMLDMRSLEQLPRQLPSDPLLLKSVWKLETYLKFPWRPLISVLGVTEYTVDEAELQVSRHVETWNISGVQAIGQIFRPSDRSTLPFMSAAQRKTQ
ncbi:hypothetical protein WJX84_007932 [Apatococcus fuscideae]|uniref:Uncharacterized protein n=1 Tax=Apatococcus fuscideae TaxID=2026836 RepID=A0AAW1SPH7_9CHLO